MENSLKLALQSFEELKNGQEKSELKLISDRLLKVEETLEQLRRAIV